MLIQGKHLLNPINFSYLMEEIRSKQQLSTHFWSYYFNIKFSAELNFH
jgi:hypothetical protein